MQRKHQSWWQSCEKRLRKLWLPRGDLTALCGKGKLPGSAPGHHWQGWEQHRAAPGRVGVGTGKHFCTVRAIRHWHRLPSEVVNVPCLSVFKRHWDNALNNMLQLFCISFLYFYFLYFLILSHPISSSISCCSGSQLSWFSCLGMPFAD